MNYLQKQDGYFFPDTKNISSACSFLADHMADKHFRNNDWIVLCIGTDRVTGDCLGPMVGTKLLSLAAGKPVYGTLEHPVHAMNLPSVLDTLRTKYPCHRFLAVDAAVGPKEHVGTVAVSASSIYPGDGMRKALPPVGDISITGIVGESGGDPELTLPYTRLYLVNTLAEFISRCIAGCLQ